MKVEGNYLIVSDLHRTLSNMTFRVDIFSKDVKKGSWNREFRRASLRKTSFV